MTGTAQRIAALQEQMKAEALDGVQGAIEAARALAAEASDLSALDVLPGGIRQELEKLARSSELHVTTLQSILNRA